jgi:predicted nucleic acid-binding protein
MRYVVDASVALTAVLPGTLRAKALQLQTDYQNRIQDLLAPDIFIAETANALTKAERQKLIKVGRASFLHGTIMNARPVLHAYVPLVSRAIEISAQTRSASYDCLYVALAEREVCELVTVDDKLVRNLHPQFPFIVHLSALP